MCGGHNGKLVKSGLANWYCDTETVWKNGTLIENDELISIWSKEGILEDILQGNIHLIWTGGEPLLPSNSQSIINFLRLLDKNVYNEIETNGTIYMNDNLFSKIQQINCSPKLKNSGMSEKIRINGDALKRINSHSNSWFKFVVSSEDDIGEIFNGFIIPFNLDKKKIILMPALDKQEDFFEATKMVFELAKKYKLRVVSRMHIAAWGMTTGV
jgi:organic radical activating enzyme